MVGCNPALLSLDVPTLRGQLAAIRPAAEGISPKTFSNLRTLFASALEWAGVVAFLGRGRARRDPAWAPLLAGTAHDKRLANGLAAFANWCAENGIAPTEVDDGTVQRFHGWLVSRTLHPKPKNVVRRVPQIWNEARALVPGWPETSLAAISFREISVNLRWDDLPSPLRRDAEAYLATRREPDLFDTSADHPKRPLAPSTLHQHKEHIRLAASVLMRERGNEAIHTLADLVRPEALKTVLRHYLGQANGGPSAFATSVAKTLIDVARFQVKAPEETIRQLKAIAAKLPARPFDLTAKNKELLRLLESEATRARLLFLPERLMRRADAELKAGRLDFVAAQVAVAIEILLIAPLRMQNLIDLHWSRNFKEPNGPNGHLLLHIPRAETKSGRRDLSYEIPKDLARTIRWYRREILPRLGADIRGHLFVTEGGKRKHQETLAIQIIGTIAEHVGVHMTPHQFRHFAAMLYLEEHPEGFQNVTDLLGHSWAKTTQIYAGSSSRRASRAYGNHIVAKRAALQFKRHARREAEPMRPLKHLPVAKADV